MIGYIAGTLTTVAFAPQLLRALNTKSTKDVSLMMLLCSTSGMLLWMLHGIQVNDPALIAANSISFVLTFLLLGSSLKMTIRILFLISVVNLGNLKMTPFPLKNNLKRPTYIYE